MHSLIGSKHGRHIPDNSRVRQDSIQDRSQGLFRQPNKPVGLSHKTFNISKSINEASEKNKKYCKLGLPERTLGAKPVDNTTVKPLLECQSLEFDEQKIALSSTQEETSATEVGKPGVDSACVKRENNVNSAVKKVVKSLEPSKGDIGDKKSTTKLSANATEVKRSSRVSKDVSPKTAFGSTQNPRGETKPNFNFGKSEVPSLLLKGFEQEINKPIPTAKSDPIPTEFIHEVLSDGTYLKNIPNSSIKFRLSSLPKSADQVDDPTSIRRDAKLANPEPRYNSKGNMRILPANLIELDNHDANLEQTLDLIHDSKNNLYDLIYDIGPPTLITSAQLSEFKRRFRGVILPLRDILTKNMTQMPEQNRNRLSEILINAVEAFVKLADKQILNVFWVSAWEKASVIRQKADFLRYLLEIFPDNEDYLQRCQVAYKDAKLFFIENNFLTKAEWIYLQMNYASFLYMTGARVAAIYITQKLLKSLTAKRCGEEVLGRLASNLKFYNQL